MSDEIYVVVVDNDQCHNLPNGEQHFDEGGPLVMEQYTRNADLENVVRRISQLGGKYGKARIARLQFLDEKES